MKVLMVNKFLQPRGGAETYVLSLGKQLADIGHEVEYFGMDQPGRCVGNSAQAYTSNMDFHGGSKLVKLTYPFKTIYSTDARKKLRMVLEQFQLSVDSVSAGGGGRLAQKNGPCLPLDLYSP